MLKLFTAGYRFTICPLAKSRHASTVRGISSGFFFSAFAASTTAFVGTSGKYRNFESGVNCGPPDKLPKLTGTAGGVTGATGT